MRLKTVQQERHSFELKVKICVEKLCETVSRIDGEYGIDPDLFLVNAKQCITNLLIDRRQTKVKLIFFVHDGEG